MQNNASKSTKQSIKKNNLTSDCHLLTYRTIVTKINHAIDTRKLYTMTNLTDDTF